MQGSRPRGAQDAPGQWGLHHRISKQRVETIRWQENSHDMHAHQVARWGRSTVESSSRTYSRRLNISHRIFFLVLLKHVSIEGLTLDHEKARRHHSANGHSTNSRREDRREDYPDSGRLSDRWRD